MGVGKLELQLDTIAIYEPGVLITLDAFNKYMLLF